MIESRVASAKFTLAIDAMGGDHGPEVVLRGLDYAISNTLSGYDLSGLSFMIYGDGELLSAIIKLYPNVSSKSKIVSSHSTVSQSDKPLSAFRQKKDSSMYFALTALKDGEAHACISLGNTGALMVFAKFLLGTLPGIDRPAIATIFPALKNDFIALDVGGNVDCKEDILFQFAVMGVAYARVYFGVDMPRLAVLNIGEEETKGNSATNKTAEKLRELGDKINFVGYAEPSTLLTKGEVDVMVSDGFVGNIMIKTAEAAAIAVYSYSKEFISSSMLGRVLAFLFMFLFRKKFSNFRFNPDKHNGAVLLGLSNVVVKSHGGCNYRGYAHAVKLTIDAVIGDLNAQIVSSIRDVES